MSSATKIYIPAYISNQNILDVISKIAGSVYTYNTKGDDTDINYEQPTSETNYWAIGFSDSHIELAKPANLTNCNLIFNDIESHQHSWFFYIENDSENYKILSPPCTPFAIAIGKRLVDFFGGFLLLNDSFDDQQVYYYSYDLENNIVENISVKFPQKTMEQSSSERHYQFQNLLCNESIITVNELNLSKPFARYNSDSFYNTLVIHENYHNLLKNVPAKHSIQKPANKVKI